MYFLYLDESGVPQTHPSQTSHYVLLGAAVHEGTWFALSDRLMGVRRKYALGDPRDFEIHAKDLMRPFWEQARIVDFQRLSRDDRKASVLQVRTDWEDNVAPTKTRKGASAERKRFRQTEPYIHLTFDERKTVLKDTLKVVGSHYKGPVLFCEAIHKPSMRPGEDPVEQAFEQVLTRFEAFLKRQKNNWGILVMDEDRYKSGTLQNMLREFQYKGSPYGNIDRIVESPFFVDSAANSGVQAVDAAAYAVRRYLENKEYENFSIIFDKFDRDRKALHGIRHFRRFDCDCTICKERKGKRNADTNP